MTVLHSGTSRKYSENWDQVFGGGKKSTAKASAKRSTKKKATKKKAAKRKKKSS